MTLALLKNLQASIVNATGGMAATDGGDTAAAVGTNLAYGLEMGTQWGEETGTEFENETLLHPELGRRGLRAQLVEAYQVLYQSVKKWEPLRSGSVYYHRNSQEGGDKRDGWFPVVTQHF